MFGYDKVYGGVFYAPDIEVQSHLGQSHEDQNMNLTWRQQSLKGPLWPASNISKRNCYLCCLEDHMSLKK
jgi:hypothetical protein